MPINVQDLEESEEFLRRWLQLATARHAPYDLVCPDLLMVLTTNGSELPHGIRRSCWTDFRWWAAGKPLFKLTHGLTASLVLTDCQSVRTDEIKMPFDAFTIELPQPDPIITMGPGSLSDDPAEPVTRLQVTSSRSINDPKVVDACNAIRRNKTLSGAERADQELALLATHGARENCLDGSIWISLRGTRTAQVMRVPPMSRFETFGEWVDAIQKAGSGDQAAQAARARGGVVANAAMVRTLGTLIANLVLYLGSTKGEPLDRYAPARPHVEGRPRVFTVGRAVKLPSALMQAAREVTLDGAAQTRWKLKSRFVVMGHWKNQPCGPGHSERKRIHIESYWKGPTGAEAIARVYEVDSLKNPDRGDVQ